MIIATFNFCCKFIMRLFIRRLHLTSLLRNAEGNVVTDSSASPLTYTIYNKQEVLPFQQHEPEVIRVQNNKFSFKDIGPNDAGYSQMLVKLTDYFYGNEYQSINAIKGQKNWKKAQKIEQRTFQDLKLIRLKTGKGGNGAISFFRDASHSQGPPDGGDGGNGGNIYVQVVNTVNSLHRVKRSYQAKGGQPGRGKQLDGKNGEDLILEVPVGTTMRWIPDPLSMRDYFKSVGKDDIWLNILGDSENKDIQLFRNSYGPGKGWNFKEHDEEYYREKDYFQDLDNGVKVYDQEIINEEIFQDNFPLLGMDFNKVTQAPVLLFHGGKGGMGNMNFLTKDIRNPNFSKQGRDGLTEFFLLELKLIADLGLVGLPNAGKSTLLRAISKARPRVGHWEFTTLQPTIGTINTSIDKDPFTVADIPGIIKGASDNKGMGLDFLRHVERCKGLVFVISLENNPVSDLKVLMEEVGEKKLQNKSKLIIATKADLTQDSSKFDQLCQFVDNTLNKKEKWFLLPVCASQNENIEVCIKMMSQVAEGLKA